MFCDIYFITKHFRDLSQCLNKMKVLILKGVKIAELSTLVMFTKMSLICQLSLSINYNPDILICSVSKWCQTKLLLINLFKKDVCFCK